MLPAPPRADAASERTRIEIHPNTALIRIEPDFVRQFDGSGASLAYDPRAKDPLELYVPQHVEIERVVSDISLDLLRQAHRASRQTYRNVSSSFRSFQVMNGTVFVIGVAGFVAAMIKGFTSSDPTDALVTAAFGGVSAASFIAFFLSRPLDAVATSGPHNAWLLAIVSTYWTKLAYFNNPRTAVKDIDAAGRAMSEAMVMYLQHAHSTKSERSRRVGSGGPSGNSARAPKDPAQPMQRAEPGGTGRVPSMNGTPH